MAASNRLSRLTALVWGDWQTNALWQRIVKYSLAGVIAVSLAILPRFKTYSTFLTPMVVVFAHPGQRMGIMVEALLMIIFGFLLGLSWSLLGSFLAGLVQETNPVAACSIRTFFLLACVVLHGLVRSSSPRLTNFVLFLLIAALLTTIRTPSAAGTSLYVTEFMPVLMGGGVLVFANLAVFPELSSSYLGTSTIHTLSATMDTLTRATHWFITPGGDPLQVGSHSHPLRLTATRKTNGSVSRPRGKMRRHVRHFMADFPNPFRPSGPQAALSSTPIHLSTLVQLAGQKSRLRSQLSSCKKAQDEVDFEVSVSPLAPATMKDISVVSMTGLVQNTVTLIGACENKYIFLNDEQPPGTDDEAVQVAPTKQVGIPQQTQRPIPSFGRAQCSDGNFTTEREMMGGSELLLEKVLRRIRTPVQKFQISMNEAVNVLICCLAYCFDVSRLPSGSPAPRGIHLAEIDIRIDQFTASIAELHRRSTEELKIAVMGDAGEAVDFMPRRETFLVSSFLLAYQASADQVLEMLRHARKLVEKRQRRHDRSRIWIPQLRDFRKWLATGGETDGMVLPKSVNKAAHQQHDLKAVSSRDQRNDSLDNGGTSPVPKKEKSVPTDKDREALPPKSASFKRNKDEKRRKRYCHGPNHQASTAIRGGAADAIEWVKHSDHVHYALKLAIAIFLVTWPALSTSSNAWYSRVKGVWAPMQLILVFEVAIGTSLFGFATRLFGVVFGCLVGYLSVEVARGYRVAAVVVLAMGIVPSVYVQIATKYVKAGMISIVSMAVVALAAVNHAGSPSVIFYKRLVAFLVGGLVAIGVEAFISPVRARDRLVESLSTAVRQVQKMQAAISVGIDDAHRPNFRSRKLFGRFNHCRDKAQAALAAAEAILPFCLTEPRLKGSFKPLASTYKQIIYILQQITDRMDNMIQLRRAYGSSVLEDLNPQVHAFRRNVTGSSALILFSINEALTNWLPLPQFLPSTRLAELRLINRIRELLTAQSGRAKDEDMSEDLGRRPFVTKETAEIITQQKFLSWNATTAVQMEIIEYLEELVDLVKLLVGVEAFQSGMLERPQYRQYIRQLETEQEEDLNRVHSGQRQQQRNGQRQEGEEEEENGVMCIDCVDLDRVESGSHGLCRAPTTTQRHAGARRTDGEGASQAEEEEEEDDDNLRYTQMLQRVGSRLKQSDTLVRRQAASTSHGNAAHG
ncbi:hypothetical protein E4U42_007995 [Claviceps africana]|uniref:Uncharacterized protein n=1 Tax=Claviceps africana TaxID=83212 RepID=A0A8K0NKY3_9HYPO|nr:hypothetical protein E4U42_007995 [Claviceps africana]